MLLPALTDRPLLSNSTRPEWGTKRKNCINLPQCLPYYVDQGSQQSSRHCRCLRAHLQKGRRASWAPSVPSMAGCPHGHHEPPATALLRAASYPFPRQVSSRQGVLQYLSANRDRSLYSCLGAEAFQPWEEPLLEVSVKFRSSVR